MLRRLNGAIKLGPEDQRPRADLPNHGLVRTLGSWGKPPSVDDLFQEEADNPLVADRRNFFKVELWTRDGRRVERLLFAGKQPRQSSRAVRCLQQEAAAGAVDHPTEEPGAGEVAQGPERRTIVRQGQHGASDRRIHQRVTCV